MRPELRVYPGAKALFSLHRARAGKKVADGLGGFNKDSYGEELVGLPGFMAS